jgi:predicted Zn-dependent protease
MTPEQRLETFRKFLEAKPDDAFARYSLAMQLRSMDRAEEAVEAFRELTRRAPDYVPTWLMLGQSLEGLGRAQEAARVYEEGMAVAGRRQDPHARAELEEALERVRAT